MSLKQVRAIVQRVVCEKLTERFRKSRRGLPRWRIMIITNSMKH